MPVAATKSKKAILAQRSKSRSQVHWPWSLPLIWFKSYSKWKILCLRSFKLGRWRVLDDPYQYMGIYKHRNLTNIHEEFILLLLIWETWWRWNCQMWKIEMMWTDYLVWLQYGISQLTSHQCSRTLADCRNVISIVVTSSKYVGNFDHRSNLTWSFEQVFLRFTDSSKLSQFVN